MTEEACKSASVYTHATHSCDFNSSLDANVKKHVFISLHVGEAAKLQFATPQSFVDRLPRAAIQIQTAARKSDLCGADGRFHERVCTCACTCSSWSRSDLPVPTPFNELLPGWPLKLHPYILLAPFVCRPNPAFRSTPLPVPPPLLLLALPWSKWSFCHIDQQNIALIFKHKASWRAPLSLAKWEWV